MGLKRQVENHPVFVAVSVSAMTVALALGIKGLFFSASSVSSSYQNSGSGTLNAPKGDVINNYPVSVSKDEKNPKEPREAPLFRSKVLLLPRYRANIQDPYQNFNPKQLILRGEQIRQIIKAALDPVMAVRQSNPDFDSSADLLRIAVNFRERVKPLLPELADYAQESASRLPPGDSQDASTLKSAVSHLNDRMQPWSDRYPPRGEVSYIEDLLVKVIGELKVSSHLYGGR